MQAGNKFSFDVYIEIWSNTPDVSGKLQYIIRFAVLE